MPSIQLLFLVLKQYCELDSIIWLILLMTEYGHLLKIEQTEHIKVKIRTQDQGDSSVSLMLVMQVCKLEFHPYQPPWSGCYIL